MDISIALATYNGERFLEEQLQSIAKQTVQPSELVVCDDRSTDRTMELLEEFRESVPFDVRINRNESRLGPAKNFGRAISLCRGDLIALADQDDVWLEHKLETCLEAVEASPELGLVFSDAQLVDENLEPLSSTMWETVPFGPREKRIVEEGRAFELLSRRSVVTGMTMVFRTGCRECVLPIPEGWIHDEWAAMVISAFRSIDFIDEPLVLYRQHDSNVTGANMGGDSASWLRSRIAGLSPKPDYYAAEAERIKSALEGLGRLRGSVPNLDSKLDTLANAYEHKMARAKLDRSIVRRAPTVLHELKSGRYHEFSNGGYGAAIKDLFIGGWGNS